LGIDGSAMGAPVECPAVPRDRDERARTYAVKLVRGPFVRVPRHQLACETEPGLLKLASRLSRPLAADLFSGAGCLSLRISEAGFDVVLTDARPPRRPQ
jgi:DNA (cytosine-5)-methyltransferase 1